MESPELQRIADVHRGRSEDEHSRASAEPVLNVHEIGKVYRVGEIEVHALRKVTLSLAAGEFVVLLGTSGSGKSTLLNVLGVSTRPRAVRPGTATTFSRRRRIAS